ncbi:GNAT family N-acetyltransferase [Candidatus Babeliales bacterium]|nr:GNAT family N-acetyltransferase [Candidatus Babeliales bacterium]
MNMKRMFFLFLLTLTFVSQDNLSAAASKFLSAAARGQKLYGRVLSTSAPLALPADAEHGFVDDYQSADQEEVLAIAQQDLPNLVDLQAYSWSREKALHEDILPVLNGEKNCVSKVYRMHGAPVGFVNYTIRGDSATLHHIAVHKDFRGKGIGSALVQSMFDDCYAQGAKSVGLMTVGNMPASDLGHFYYKKLGIWPLGRPGGTFSSSVVWGKMLQPLTDEECYQAEQFRTRTAPSTRVIYQTDEEAWSRDTKAGIAGSVAVALILGKVALNAFADAQRVQCAEDNVDDE